MKNCMGLIPVRRTHALISAVLTGLLALGVVRSVRAAEPHWIRVSTSHFAVLSDADEKRSREAAVRLEQMRAVFAQLLGRNRLNLSEPLDIIAVRSDDEYFRVAPVRDGRPIGAIGFFIPGTDRNYIVLDLGQEDAWRSISYDFAMMLLTYNYPPTQAWFDEGFAEYFSSLRLGTAPQIGGEPASGAAHSKSFGELLSTQPWQPLSSLLTASPPAAGQDASRDTLFAAQSWILMHYLINKDKQEQTGTYFDLVENQKLAPAEAIQKAFGQSEAQLEHAVKDYFATLKPQMAAAPGHASGAQIGQLSPLPADPEIGSSTQPVTDADGQALLAEMTVRLPEHRDAAVAELETAAGQAKTDSVIVRRALAWAHLQKKEFEGAVEELGKAAELDPKDAWLHYYLAQMKYHIAQSGGQQFQGLSNMMQDLRLVLDWDPEFAEAYNLLGLARVEGGGINSAMEAMRAAIRLNPRSERYLLNMAQIYMAGKNWDAATALLDRLKNSADPEMAASAHRNIEDLPTLQKYGVLPQRETAAQAPASAPAAVSHPAKAQAPAAAAAASSVPSDEIEVRSEPAPVQIDRRPIRFLKGRLASVDCSQAPAAVLSVAGGGKTWKLRTEDYKSLAVVGADEFSCAWANRQISVNYKAGGKADGDLVSVEVQ